MATRKKNSLVENINRRKRRGTSRPKAKSTVSKDAYDDMQRGWPRKGASKKKRGGAGKKKAGGSRKKAGARRKRTARSKTSSR